MTYGIGIGFPVEPSKEDLKKIKRDLAYSLVNIWETRCFYYAC